MRLHTILAVIILLPCIANAQQPDKASPQDMQAMMEKSKNITQPGKKHEFLNRFVGDWEVQTRFVMNGKKTPPEKGNASFQWMDNMGGRWLSSKISGTMMGRPSHGFMLIGYDNFKKSFVVTTVNNHDTSMLRSEGDLTRDKKALITYGTLNEYLTGEHDKMVKYIWRFKSENEFVLEVHDLHIGESNTMVLEDTFTRVKD